MSTKDMENKESERKIDFKSFVASLYMGGIVSLGITPDPLTKEIRKNPEFTQETIEILKILKDKTKGNLTDEEALFLDDCIYKLMMSFVEVMKNEGNKS